MDATNLPTKAQLADLQELGVEFNESTLTFHEARFLLHTARPQKPASGWRLEKLESWGLANELPENASMEDLVYFFNAVKYEPPTRKQVKSVTELGLKVRRSRGMTAGLLDDLLGLQGQPPREEDVEILKEWGVTHSGADAFKLCAMSNLIRCFVDLAGLALRSCSSYAYLTDANIASVRSRVSSACITAMADPAYHSATIAEGDYGLVFSWPKDKVREWYA